MELFSCITIKGPQLKAERRHLLHFSRAMEVRAAQKRKKLQSPVKQRKLCRVQGEAAAEQTMLGGFKEDEHGQYGPSKCRKTDRIWARLALIWPTK
ncbi:hypothetical protein CDL15_Pgr014805 [Punica granatum]|uniref:Uncharacterized protein n=1 Tax=Punica granatum TaxID=22663 RepID=A0A218Y1T7_PUNGR|nr:hypothetical protein CDL15_Pgr014805 [Punica granatum]